MRKQKIELELNKKISQLEAELEAAMDGLRAARLETEELKSSLIEKKSNIKYLNSK